MPKQQTAPSSSVPKGADTIPKIGQWVLGVDASGKAYLFTQGGKGNYRGLVKWVTLPGNPVTDPQSVLAIHSWVSWLGLTANQVDTIIQSIDAGSLEQGGKYVAVPKDQQPGQTSPGQGQATSSSEAVNAGVSLGGLLSGLSGWEELAVRALEALAGAALILLGLQALTGTGSGNPVSAVAAARKVVK